MTPQKKFLFVSLFTLTSVRDSSLRVRPREQGARRMHWIKIWTCMLVAISLSSCSSTTQVRAITSYKEALQNRGSILVLPPWVQVRAAEFPNNQELMHEYGHYLRKIIMQEMTLAIQAKGFKVEHLPKEHIDLKSKLLPMIIPLHQAHAKTHQRLYTQPWWTQESASAAAQSVGPSFRELGTATNSDLIAITAYSAKYRHSEPKGLGLDLDQPTSDSLPSSRAAPYEAFLLISIIDAKTGKIIWTNRQDGPAEGWGSSLLTGLEGVDFSNPKKLISKVLSPLMEKKKQ